MNLLSLTYNNLIDNKSFKLLCVVILMDVVFGFLRALREKKVNSTIGIDGMIRKSAMILSIVFLASIDIIIKINMIGFLPDGLKDVLNLDYVGVNELFTFLYVIFEFLSISKNMVLCKLPIPAKWQKTLENFFKKFTGELDKVYDLKVTLENKKGSE